MPEDYGVTERDEVEGNPPLVRCECGAYRYEGGLDLHRTLDHDEEVQTDA